jgi:ankyrin repeat protein
MTSDLSDLRLAIENQDIGWARELLGAGADPNEPYANGFSLLHHAIDIEVASCQGQLRLPMTGEMVELLLHSGAKWAEQDVNGRNALDYAVFRGDRNAAAVIDRFSRVDRGQDADERSI